MEDLNIIGISFPKKKEIKIKGIINVTDLFLLLGIFIFSCLVVAFLPIGGSFLKSTIIKVVLGLFVFIIPATLLMPLPQYEIRLYKLIHFKIRFVFSNQKFVRNNVKEVKKTTKIFTNYSKVYELTEADETSSQKDKLQRIVLFSSFHLNENEIDEEETNDK